MTELDYFQRCAEKGQEAMVQIAVREFSLDIRKTKIITIKIVKHWNRLLREMRRVFILEHLQN